LGEKTTTIWQQRSIVPNHKSRGGSGPGQITPRKVIKEEHEPNQEMLAVGNEDSDSIRDRNSTSEPPIRFKNPQNRHMTHKNNVSIWEGGEKSISGRMSRQRGRGGGVGAVSGAQIGDTEKRTKRKRKIQRVGSALSRFPLLTREPTWCR
jgi:hypothetical protein